MKTRAQSTIEYAVLITIMVAAVISMSIYVKRAVKANLKSTEEQINALAWEFESSGDYEPPEPPEPPDPPKPPIPE